MKVDCSKIPDGNKKGRKGISPEGIEGGDKRVKSRGGWGEKVRLR